MPSTRVPADHDRRALGPRPARLEHAIARLVVGAVEVDLAGLQQRRDDLDRFGEPAIAVIVGIAEGAVFDLVIPHADAED